MQNLGYAYFYKMLKFSHKFKWKYYIFLSYANCIASSNQYMFDVMSTLSLILLARYCTRDVLSSNYEAQFYYLFSISWYQEIDFLISRNKTHILISRNQISDIKNQKLHFLISRKIFGAVVSLLIKYFLISRDGILDIKKWNPWYQEFDFLISRNINYFLISRNGILDIKKWNSWYQEIDFLIWRIPFLNIKNSIS